MSLEKTLKFIWGCDSPKKDTTSKQNADFLKNILKFFAIDSVHDTCVLWEIAAFWEITCGKP